MKPTHRRIARALDTVVSEREDGTTEYRTPVVISTGVEARDGNVWDQATWDLSHYEANPVVLYAHNDGDVVVGRGESLRVDETEHGPALVGEVVWDVGDHNPVGTRLAIQYARGFMRAFSARIDPTVAKFVHRRELPDNHPARGDSGYLVQGLGLLEFSAVPIPADPHATAQRDEGGGEVDALRADLLRLIRTDPEIRRAIEAIPLTRAEPSTGDAPHWFDGLVSSTPLGDLFNNSNGDT